MRHAQHFDHSCGGVSRQAISRATQSYVGQLWVCALLSTSFSTETVDNLVLIG